MVLESFEIIRVLLLTAVSFVVAILWLPLLLKMLIKFRMGKSIREAKDAPVFAGLHAKKSGTPTMGGLLVWVTVAAVAIALWLVSVIFPNSVLSDWNFLTRAQTLLPLGALVAAALVGLADDYFNVRKIGPGGGGLKLRHKLLLYLGMALVGAWWFTVKLNWDLLHIPFVGSYNIGLWYIPFFLLVIVATSFSVNETDGLDGLAGGTLFTSFGAFAIISFAQGKYDLAAFCGVIIGALLAFLWANINPAKWFMGDTGSMSLGVTLGIVALLTNSALLLPFIGLIFVMESLSVIIQMTSKKIWKKKIFLSTPVHHHFEALGWPESAIVMRFWVISMVAAAVGTALALLDALIT